MIRWNEYEKYRNDRGYQDDSGITDLPMDYNSKEAKRSRRSAKRAEFKTGYVTRKAFIIGIICAMLATSGLTVGGLSLAGAFDKTIGGNTHSISATNYTLAEATGAQKSIEEIVAMNENAVVEIQTETVVSSGWFGMGDYLAPGAGSGVIIDSNGYILTCNHVIEDAKTVNVITKDGATHQATVVGVDSLSDVAVLKIDGSGYAAVQYGDSSSISVGDLAVAIGNPLGKLGGSASVGIISSLNRELVLDGKPMTLMQTDASINPGNSGGGLFDGQGNLIGIVVAKSQGSDIEGLGFAIPIEKAAAVAKQLIDNGKVSGRPMIGITIIDAYNVAYANQYGYDAPGIYIHEVTGTEANEAGLKTGDAIQAVNGVEIIVGSDLTREVNKYTPGDTITLTVLREGKSMDIETVLKEAD